MQILVNTDSHIEGGANLTQEVETTVRQALGRFGERITRVQVYLSDENSPQKFGDADKRCVMEARLGGLQPITVSHQGSSLDQAVGGAADKLEKTLKRTLRRKDSIFKRRVREREELVAVDPRLRRDAETGQQEDFIQSLRPRLGYLANHARRELRIMEANGTLSPGRVVLEDLLDEVVTRGWLQFADRPQELALDLWLTKLLDQLLEEKIDRDRLVQGTPRGPAKEEPPRDAPQVGEQEWWGWLLGEGDATAQEIALPGRRSVWAEEYLETEELMRRIHALLGDLPRVQRQAFVLNVLEAYELFEIAMLQDRPETEVRADIEAARNHLRERLSAGVGAQASADQAAEEFAGSTEEV
jgi:DNA-directed RNA polymerase specialized sigma24 family protein/ribosome-associated translation inhibitor RaiA